MSARPECFYCGALVSGNGRGDHFPIPRNAGGTETVPCCESCHDMKDRFAVDKWPIEWIGKVIADFPNLSRETRLFLARFLRGFSESTKEVDLLRSIVKEQRSAWRRALVSLYAFPGITDWRTYPNPQRSDGLFVAQEGRLEYGEQAVPYGVRSICSQLPHEDAKWVAEQLNVSGKQLAEGDRVWDEWHPVGRLYRETERLHARIKELEGAR